MTFNLKITLILLFSIFSIKSLSQNIDSLKQEIQNTRDEKKAVVLSKIGDFYMKKFELDSSYKYFSRAIKSAETDLQKSNIYENIGMIYFYKNNFSKALDVFNKSLIFAQNTGKDSIIARRYSDIGVVYDYLSAYDKAVDYYVKALKLFKKTGDKYGMAKTLNNLGIINENQGRIIIALKYYKTALNLKKKIKTPNIDLASTYVNIGSALEKKRRFEEALKNYQKAYNIFKNTNIKKYTALTLNNIANTYFYLKKFDSAKIFINKAELLNKKISNKLGLTSNFILKAKILKKENKLDSSIFFLQKALDLTNNLGIIKKKADVLRELSEIYELKKNYTKAYLSAKELIAINDSLFNKNISDKTEKLQIVYETEKKQDKINNLQKNIEKNKLLLTASIFILILLLISIFFIVRQKLIKAKYRENLFNQKLLRAQMNPHFIFNALTSIQSFMLEKDTKKATTYLSAFSKLTRSILNNSQADVITIQEEIETIENYCKIQQMRFDNKFEFKIIIDKNIDTEELLIPPMLAQPFVENAIKHGFKNINYKGIITITYKIINNNLQVSITDNGIGIDIKPDKNKKTHAIEITKQRLKILNKKKKNLFSFKIENIDTTKKEKKGTRIIFSLPLKIK